MEIVPRRADHDQRRRRDVPGPGRRPRRADPARGQRALLGEGARQEQGARVPARGRRARRAQEPRRQRRPRGARPCGRDPRPRRRRARRLRGQPLAARRRPRGTDRRTARPAAGADRAHRARRRACTISASSPSPTRSCASPARSPTPSASCSSAIRRSATACSRASPSTPVADWVLHHHERWDGTGYPDGLEAEDDPARRADHPRRRRVRRDDERPRLPAQADGGGGARRARGLLGHAVRPARWSTRSSPSSRRSPRGVAS